MAVAAGYQEGDGQMPRHHSWGLPSAMLNVDLTSNLTEQFPEWDSNVGQNLNIQEPLQNPRCSLKKLTCDGLFCTRNLLILKAHLFLTSYS